MGNETSIALAAIEEHSTRLLEQVVAILRACSLSDEAICQSLKAALQRTQHALGEVRQLAATADFHLSCCDLVFRWRHDPDFLDRTGCPLRLPLTGGEKSFEALTPRSSLGTPDEYLRYLEDLGAVTRSEDGLVELRMDSVLACSRHSGRSVSGQTVLAHVTDFVSTVRFNLESGGAASGGFFERACYGRIPASYIPILQRLIDERGQNLIDGVDEWLARHNLTEAEVSDCALVGVGAYMYVRPS